MSRTVLYGGTFNPFHIGHYETLKVLNDLPEVDRVLLMPDRIPPHKKQSFAVPDEVRIEMCRLAVQDLCKTELCLVEFEREGKSYTFDTVTLFKQKYPQEDFWFACGGDMIMTLDTWYRSKELIKLCGFYTIERKGSCGFTESVERLRRQGAKIHVLDADIPEISSTQLRERMKKGIYDNFLPDKIRDYLSKTKVYEGETLP
ncbi:MAG: nicotinate (nicotinamide) nucleotide adenylyltransferase [Clostridia bacterium]|nr:nicotinate (nicotinamide) nucleotide adenylyltransferase [Clostridia bacterium]